MNPDLSAPLAQVDPDDASHAEIVHQESTLRIIPPGLPRSKPIKEFPRSASKSLFNLLEHFSRPGAGRINRSRGGFAFSGSRAEGWRAAGAEAGGEARLKPAPGFSSGRGSTPAEAGCREEPAEKRAARRGGGSVSPPARPPRRTGLSGAPRSRPPGEVFGRFNVAFRNSRTVDWLICHHGAAGEAGDWAVSAF